MTSETTQQSPMMAEPQKEHHWLQKLVGEWTFESEASMGPDKPPEKSTGTESVRPLGGLWIVGEGKGEVPGGGEHRSIITLGYDPTKKRFVGSFISSMMTAFWLYDGGLDAGSKVLTLNTEGPSMADDGSTAKYQETIELVSDDHRVFKSRVLGDDGQWQEFMTAHYRRTR
jgi:hypothetical protein